MGTKEDKRIYTLSREKPVKAVAKMSIPLLLLFNMLFGFEGMLFAQPVTEAVMMMVSLLLLVGMISMKEDKS